jgi:hypothetical protein
MAEYLQIEQGKVVELARTIIVKVPDGLTAEDVLDSSEAFVRLWDDHCGEWECRDIEVICDEATEITKRWCKGAIELSAEDIAAIKAELGYGEVRDG